MKIYDHEAELIYNPIFSCELIWTAIKEAAVVSNDEAIGLPIPLLSLVLPLTLHKDSSMALATKQRPGGLIRAIMEDRSIVVGLEDRIASNFDLTMNALGIGLTSGLLKLSKSQQFFIGLGDKKNYGINHVSIDALSRVAASKRIGQAFVEIMPSQLFSLLGLRN